MDSDIAVSDGRRAVRGTYTSQLLGNSIGIALLDKNKRTVERAAETGADIRATDSSEATTLSHDDIEEIGATIVASRKNEKSTTKPERERYRSDETGGDT